MNRQRLAQWTLTALMLLLVMGAGAQRTPSHTGYFSIPLPNQHLIPVSGIKCIMQDSEGYMWYATVDGGLCRDDGYQVDVFRADRQHPDLLRSNDITCLTEDKQGNIVFGTRKGFYYLDKHDYSIHEFRTPDSVPQKAVSICATHDGEIWIADGEWVYRYDSDYHYKARYQPTNTQEQPTGYVMFCEDHLHQLWALLRNRGLARFDAPSDKWVAYDLDMEANPTNIIEDRQHKCFWIATEEAQMVCYKVLDAHGTGRMTIIDLSTMPLASQRRASNSINYDNRRGLLWQSTVQNLFAYRVSGTADQPHLECVDNSMSDQEKLLSHTFIDNTGHIWVSGSSPQTFILSPPQDCVSRTSDPRLVEHTQMPFLITDAISEKDDSQLLWMLYDRRGLVLYNISTQEYTLAKDMPGTQLGNLKPGFALCRNQRGFYGFTSTKVFHVWNEGMQIREEVVCGANDHISCLAEDASGHLYVGNRLGLNVYDTQTKSMRILSENIGNVYDLAVDPSGRGVYLCTSHYALLHCTPEGQITRLCEEGKLYQIACTPDGTIWGTDNQGNVMRYDRQAQRLVTDDMGSSAYGNSTSRMQTDRNGHLWILNNQYVKEYDPKKQRFRVLTCSSRLVQMSYLANISCCGNIINLCGAGGVLQLEPKSDIMSTQRDFHPLVSGIIIDGQKHFLGRNQHAMDIPSDATTVGIQLTSFNFLDANEVVFSYRLGKDDVWHELTRGTNSISFTNLPKGTYTLTIRATDAYGVWDESTMTFTLHRLPAWWETWWAYTLYIIIVAGVLFLLLNRYRKHKEQQRQHEMEQRITEMKFRFFTNISHELRTPLTLIITPLEKFVKEDERLKGVLHGAHQLLDLINRLLDFRKLEMGEQRLHLSNGDIHEFVRSACEAFRPLANERGIALGYAISETPLYMNFDSNKMHHVLYNLLSNALKFTPNGGHVTVRAVKRGGEMCITVEDSGCGIAQADLGRIFERFYQAESSAQNTGTGIGLHIVREFATLHQGRVEVNSQLGKGTTFTVIIPTDLKREKQGAIDADVASTAPAMPADQPGTTADNARGTTSEHQNATADGKSAYTLLLVDDTPELLQMLSQELGLRYQLHTAADGKEALALCQREKIDLVVSDVMMPVMDGFELCQQLKDNVETSHIPVILLTAKAGNESMLKGYKHGADAYLNKPFNMEMLEVCIHNLIESRKQKIAAFQKAEEPTVKELVSNELDKQFLENAMKVIEKHLDNSELTTEEFASEMCMSRASLYRKFTAITGQKPSEFVRTIRLQHACRLLKTGKYKVSDIGFMVGFSSPSYFYRCFKEVYGVQPSQYK